jgi:hypothetical protein
VVWPFARQLSAVCKREKLPALAFVLDVDFNVAQADSDTTVYPNIDKDKYLDIYKDNKTMKNLTSILPIPTCATFRSIPKQKPLVLPLTRCDFCYL